MNYVCLIKLNIIIIKNNLCKHNKCGFLKGSFLFISRQDL